MASLLEMSEFGGTDASSLKNGIDSIFDETNGQLKLDAESYSTKIIGCTSDGASVNFGRKSGLMTRMASTRPWLIKIHCANHRIELAVKDAVNGTDFTSIDDFFIANFSLLKKFWKDKKRN